MLRVISVPFEIGILFRPHTERYSGGNWEAGYYWVTTQCGSLISPMALTVANDAEAQDTLKSDRRFLKNNDIKVPKDKSVDTWVPAKDANGNQITGLRVTRATSPAGQGSVRRVQPQGEASVALVQPDRAERHPGHLCSPLSLP